MNRPRVRDLADEFGTTPQAVLKLLWSRGFPVRGINSRLDPWAEEWVRFEFTGDRLSRLAGGADRQRPLGRAPSAVSPTLREPSGAPARWWRRREPDISPFGLRQPNHAASRMTEVFGTRPEEATGLDLVAVAAGLDGSPYSLPTEQGEYLSTSFLPRLAALSIRARSEAERVTGMRRATLRRITRSTEIYESNRIEGLGPDLATTDRLLTTYELNRRVDISIAHQAINRCLTSEPKIRDVVGLGAARLLAEIFCSDKTRRLSETDIRQLHELVMVGDPQGGAYKAYANQIEGSRHVPTTPVDTPAAMAELVAWLAETKLAPLWRAAVAHAWLTHIHPFHDGNGRIARLLANLVLIREDLPPLIVNASSDRGAYLDALAASDHGGDILPLARVFRRVLSRAVQDLGNPSLADQVFDAAISEQSLPRHVRWNQLMVEFLSELAPHLLLHRLNLHIVGEVTEAELLRIAGGSSENAWVAKVMAGPGSRDLLLHVAAPSSSNRGRMDSTDITPSMFVSVRSERSLDARQYLPVGQRAFTYEFTPLVDNGTILIRRGGDSRELPVHVAASAVADHLARTYRQLISA